MKPKESKENFILNLFDWRIKKLLALQYFRILYLIAMILITLVVALYEFYIARYLGVSTPLKFLLGIGAIIGGLLSILFLRIIYEFYFAFFYIERHLRDINRKS
jgi:Mn2+/Fe2+ NRAMP family transporter